MLILINCSEQTNFKFFPKNSIISDSYSSNNINYNEQPHKKYSLFLFLLKTPHAHACTFNPKNL